MSVAARVGLLITILTAFVCLALAPQARSPRTASAIDASKAARILSMDDENGSALSEDDDDEGVVDLYGNRVTDAVAKYELDATGGLYELHSPQTELPRLKSPKS